MSLGRRLSRRDSSLLFSKLFARTASYIDCNLALKDKRLSLGGTGKDNALRIDMVILGTAEPEFIDAKSSRVTYCYRNFAAPAIRGTVKNIVSTVQKAPFTYITLLRDPFRGIKTDSPEKRDFSAERMKPPEP